MDASKKTHSFSLFNLAKTLSPLPNSEKAAIVAMADHIRRPEGYCSASLETLANEIGASVRGIRYGIHGRSKKDGTKYNPGLLERGLIFMDLGCSTGKGGLSKATVYRA